MRKLLFAACGYTAALLLTHYLLPWEWILPAGGVFMLLALAALLLRGDARRMAMIPLLAAAVACGWYWGYTRLFVDPAEDCADQERSVTVRVAECPVLWEDYSSVTVRSVDAEVPHVRMLVYDYDAGMAELRPGDLVQMPLKLLSAGQYYKEESDHYLSEGVLLRGYLKGEYRVTGRAKLAWLYFPQHIARAIKAQALECFPADAVPLMKALLTGDRQEYYADDLLYTSMRTAGFSHVIAVSGLHVSFIVTAVGLLLRRRRRTALVCIPLIVVFLAMTGFTPSVVRAGVMQILLLAAPLLQRENDPLTGLSAAGLLILLINPIAVGNAGFQLSFAAMAGLILVSPLLYAFLCTDGHGNSRFSKGLPGRIAEKGCAALSASVGAAVLTTPISALWFGFLPVYAVLSNLLCLWAMSAAFLLGYPVCLLGLIWQPLGRALGWCVGWLPRYTAFVIKRIALLPGAMFCTRWNLAAWWLVFAYGVILMSILLRGEERWRPIMPVCACVLTLTLVSWFPERQLNGTMEFSTVDVGQGQCIVMLTENGTVLIDCGSTGSAQNAGDAAADWLLQYGRKSADLLVLTHFHEDHVSGVKRLLSRMTVERLAYPTDCEKDEAAEELLRLFEEAGTELYPIETDTDMTVDSLTLRLYAPGDTGDENERCLLIRGGQGDFDFLVTGDAGSSVERELCSSHAPGDLELLVVGHHGSKYSTCDTLLDATAPEAAIISVGANNGYGHPAPEVLERLNQRGIEIYRTDLDGTVTVTVGENDGEKR